MEGEGKKKVMGRKGAQEPDEHCGSSKSSDTL